MARLKRGGVPDPRRLPSRLRVLRRGRESRPRTEVSVFQERDSSVRELKMLGVRVSPISRIRKSPISRSTTLHSNSLASFNKRHEGHARSFQHVTDMYFSLLTRLYGPEGWGWADLCRQQRVVRPHDDHTVPGARSSRNSSVRRPTNLLRAAAC